MGKLCAVTPPGWAAVYDDVDVFARLHELKGGVVDAGVGLDSAHHHRLDVRIINDASFDLCSHRYSHLLQI